MAYEFTQTDEKGRSRTDTMYLDIGRSVSVFYDATKDRKSGEELKIRSASRANKAGFKSNALAERLALNNPKDIKRPGNNMLYFYIYKDRTTSETITLHELAETMKAIFREGNDLQTWNLTGEKIDIMGYPCEGAESSFRGRDYVAWYSQDIPLNDGPWKFQGLPGLILQIRSADGQIAFKVIGIESIEGDSVQVPDDSSFEKMKTLKDMINYQQEESLAHSLYMILGEDGLNCLYRDPDAWYPVQIETEF